MELFDTDNSTQMQAPGWAILKENVNCRDEVFFLAYKKPTIEEPTIGKKSWNFLLDPHES